MFYVVDTPITHLSNGFNIIHSPAFSPPFIDKGLPIDGGAYHLTTLLIDDFGINLVIQLAKKATFFFDYYNG